MHCAGESARSNGATVVQAMSWQNCVGACSYAAQTCQAEGFWHGRIVAYTGVGCIAGDASFIIAKTQTLQSTTESHSSYHARVVSLCLSISFVLQCLSLWMQCLVQVCLSARVRVDLCPWDRCVAATLPRLASTHRHTCKCHCVVPVMPWCTLCPHVYAVLCSWKNCTLSAWVHCRCLHDALLQEEPDHGMIMVSLGVPILHLRCCARRARHGTVLQRWEQMVRRARRLQISLRTVWRV